MDRITVSKSTFKETDDYVTYFRDKTLLERLDRACDIINSIFNSNPDLEVDRSIITYRARYIIYHKYTPVKSP